MMHKVGVIGDKDSILGFKAMGIKTYPVEDSISAKQTLKDLADDDFAIIFITEQFGKDLLQTVKEYNTRALPSIIFIPNNKGSLGIGMAKLREIVEKAVGADILSQKEGS